MTPSDLTDALRRVLADLGEDAAQRRLDPRWRRPRPEVGGDWSSGVALELAASTGRPATVLAADLAAGLEAVPGVAQARVTGPGFVTVTLVAPGGVVADILRAGPGFLRSDALLGRTVRLDGIRRSGEREVDDLREVRTTVVGECLRRLLAASGADVALGPARAGEPALRGVGVGIEGDAVPGVEGMSLRIGPVALVGALAPHAPAATTPTATVNGSSSGDAGRETRDAGSDLADLTDLSDLAVRLGTDTLRVGLLRVPPEEPATIDVDAWSRRDDGNPAFRLVHAQARAAREVRAGAHLADEPFHATALTDEQDAALASLLADTPRVVLRAAQGCRPDHLVRHLDLVAARVGVWTSTRGLTGADLTATGPARDEAAARRCLAEASRLVLVGGLDLLGVTAPERV